MKKNKKIIILLLMIMSANCFVHSQVPGLASKVVRKVVKTGDICRQFPYTPSSAFENTLPVREFRSFVEKYGAKFYYRDRLFPQEIGAISRELIDVSAAFKSIDRRTLTLPDLQMLQAMEAYVDRVKITTGLMADFSQVPTIKRILDPQEFVLATPKDPKGGMWGISINDLPSLPKGLRLAVVNDTPEILYKYVEWKNSGKFDKHEMSLTTYSSPEDLFSAVSSGKEYDIIITDLIMPDMRGDILAAKLRGMGNKANIFVVSAFETDAILSASETRIYNVNNLFKVGIDGYMSAVNMIIDEEKEVLEGVSGFLTFETNLRTYLYYKNLHNWER